MRHFMKTSTIAILIILSLISCNQQDDSKINDSQLSHLHLTFGIGFNNYINLYKKTNNNKQLFHLITHSWKDSTSSTENEYFVKTNQDGTLFNIKNISITEGQQLSDFIDVDDYYYVITTAIRTMNGFTKDYLNKYDKNCKLIWTKKIETPKLPDWSTVLSTTKNKELIVISNWFTPNSSSISSRTGIVFRIFDLNGNMKSERVIKEYGDCCKPVSLIKSNDNNYFLTVNPDMTYFHGRDTNAYITLFKLNDNGDILWTKEFADFYPKQTIETKDSELVLFGAGFSEKHNQHYLKIIFLDNKGFIKWEKKINKYYCEEPVNMIVTKQGNLLFTSDVMSVEYDGTFGHLFKFDRKGKFIFDRYLTPLHNNIILQGKEEIFMLSLKRNKESTSNFANLLQLEQIAE